MYQRIALAMLGMYLSILDSSSVRAGSAAWPVIHDEVGRIVFDRPSEADFARLIKGRDGRPLYQFRCRSGDLDDVDGFNYSGLLQCRLSVINAPPQTPGSLLFEDYEATSDWDGRGRFVLNDVIGACGRYPDWGNTRIYRVRGIQITLKIEDLRLQKSRSGAVSATSFALSYAVQASRRASLALTAKPATKEPAWFSGGRKCLDAVEAAWDGK